MLLCEYMCQHFKIYCSCFFFFCSFLVCMLRGKFCFCWKLVDPECHLQFTSNIIHSDSLYNKAYSVPYYTTCLVQDFCSLLHCVIVHYYFEVHGTCTNCVVCILYPCCVDFDILISHDELTALCSFPISFLYGFFFSGMSLTGSST